jgi:hypothetical protein
MVIWVIFFSFSLRASSTAVMTMDSASAHSCIQEPDTGGDGLNVTKRTSGLHIRDLNRRRDSLFAESGFYGEENCEKNRG